MDANGVIFAVDPYPNGRFGFSPQKVIAQRQLTKINNGTLCWLRKTGAEAGKEFQETQKEPIDFLFIDGDHSFEGLRSDWEAWSSLVGLGGVIALHDSCSSKARNIDEAGSVKYTDSVIRNDSRFDFVEAVDTLSIFRRL
jgi:predicted O-methyltransferase YrrM